ncbi:methyltransferase domain-containing protein [Methanolacinia petrolearia]|uniref:methyltransferase domain-containing protein n=1 Tax=Methanolacinia petrolearia TaxID=54120 RepID=UPI003BAA9120
MVKLNWSSYTIDLSVNIFLEDFYKAPNSILEIGVRYGYSAITFLKAAPNAVYLGIDNNTDTFGGSIGAMEWAKKITSNYNAEFIIGDSQLMNLFPGDHWDLIHIDAQQDEDGTYNDLELALQKATWILVDGYFWSTENMFASTHFLKKYGSFIEYAIIIPGYAGDLLIKVKNRPNFKIQSYSELSGAYNHDYFEKDCGGYDTFKKTEGKRLEDQRLIAAYLLAEPMKGKRILDIGCGRGELCYALAKSGADVTGIDYSKDAIAIAKKTFEGVNISGKLLFLCCDAIKFPWEGQYDEIIATDFVEHVEDSVLENILEKCADHLTYNGKLIIHTAPNLQYYQMYYTTMRQKAKEAGCYLPQNPRT